MNTESPKIEVTAQDVAEVINALDKSFTDGLYATPPDGLEKYWHFRWREGWTAEYAMYEFANQLAYYGEECRRCEEHHNGRVCVVERVRDKYLMPKAREFLSALANVVISQPEDKA